MQNAVLEKIKAGEVVPHTEKTKKPTVFSYTIGKKDVKLVCLEDGTLIYKGNGKMFDVK